MRKLSLILTGSPIYLNETEKFKEGGHDDITLDEYTYYDEDDLEEEEQEKEEVLSKDFQNN